MPGPNDKLVQGESGDRVLKFGTLRFHHNHVQGGRTFASGCGLCTEGLEGIMQAIPAAEVEPEVVKSDGSDEEGDATPSSGEWDDPR